MTAASSVSLAFGAKAGVGLVKTLSQEAAEISKKQSTGMKYTDAQELRSQGLFTDYCNSEIKRKNLESITTSNKKVQAKLGLQTSRIENIKQMAIEMRAKVMQINPHIEGVNIRKFAEENLKQLGLVLNETTSDGSYLFGGMSSDMPPIENVEIFAESKTRIEGEPTRNYTKIVSGPETVQIDLQREISISIDAADPAFQKMIAGLQMARDIHVVNSERLVGQQQAVMNMLDDAVASFDALIIDIGFNEIILKDASRSLEDAKASVEIEISDKFRGDLAEMTEQSKDIESRIKLAMFSLASQLKKANLFDYLR